MKNILFIISIMVMGMFSFVTVSANVSSSDDLICAQDVKQCSDGSYVSRTWPKCEFAACSVKEEPVICTADVKMCSDKKTYVSRVAPSCQFAECPKDDIVIPFPLTDKVKAMLDIRIEKINVRLAKLNEKREDIVREKIITRLKAIIEEKPKMSLRIGYIISEIQ